MLLSIEPDGPVPIYQQIRDRIVEAIADGQRLAGSALPSTRQLAVDLGVNFHTVNKAYDLLRQEGLLRLGRKSGAVVRRDAGSGPPDPGWAAGLDGPAADAAGRGRRPGACRPRTSSGECQAAMTDFAFPAAMAEAGNRSGKPAMTAAALAGDLPVLVVGALACAGARGDAGRPCSSGSAFPVQRAGAPVIRRERRAYYWRTAAIGACCTVAAVALRATGHGGFPGSSCCWNWPRASAASGSRGARSPRSRTRTDGSRACGRRSSPIPAGAPIRPASRCAG